MNKLFIILLAIALASAHTYVKRDAPTDAVTESYLSTLQKDFSKFAEGFKETFNPDVIKKNFNDIVDKVVSVANQPKEKQ